MSEGAILAIDTAFGPIGVALVSMSGPVLANEKILDALGAQAEKLPPLVERMLAETQLPMRELRRIAVTVGPGAFTGVRVGLAFAKGLALALKVPLLGYTTLACLASQARIKLPGATSYASLIDARRGEVYVQGFDRELAPLFGPAVMSLEAARAELDRLPKPLVVAVREVEMADLDDTVILGIGFIDAETLAYTAMDGDPAAQPPTPCYLRAPDARLPS